MGDEYIKIQDLLDRASQSSIYSHLKIMLANTPLADVVPRETVDKLIHGLEQKRINDIENTAKIMYRKTKEEVAREIFEEIDKQIAFFRMYMFLNSGVKAIVNTLDKLKNKYIGKDTNVTTNTEG